MNYPNGIKKKKEEKHILGNTVYKNRGMSLEKDINDTNTFYIEKKKAFIYKKPTPIKLVKVDYKNKKIEEAYFEMPSTTDYNGIYKGKYIDFEAKETINKNGFPISNIHKHQIRHIRNIYNENGICFLIVRFNKINKTYLLMAKDFLEYIDNHNNSIIPIDYFIVRAYEIKEKIIPKVDYLEIIDKMEAINEKK